VTPDLIKELVDAVKELSKTVTEMRMDYLDPNQLLTTQQVARLWGMEQDEKVVLASIKAGLPTIDLGTKGYRIMRKDAVEWCEKFRAVGSQKRLTIRKRQAA
jgi:hypothetical protein